MSTKWPLDLGHLLAKIKELRGHLPVMPEIQLHEIQMVPIEKIKRDPTNPNRMTKEQMGALDESTTRFGDLVPIVLDQNYVIADGEHRLDVFERRGLKEIPAYVISLSDVERRILRQVMNKLRGTHDPDKDVQELRVLYDSGKIDELASLLAKEKDDFLEILSKSYDDIPFEKEASLDTPEIFQIIVECKNPEEQESIFNKLSREGLQCRVLTL